MAATVRLGRSRPELWLVEVTDTDYLWKLGRLAGSGRRSQRMLGRYLLESGPNDSAQVPQRLAAPSFTDHTSSLANF